MPRSRVKQESTNGSWPITQLSYGMPAAPAWEAVAENHQPAIETHDSAKVCGKQAKTPRPRVRARELLFDHKKTTSQLELCA